MLKYVNISTIAIFYLPFKVVYYCCLDNESVYTTEIFPFIQLCPSVRHYSASAAQYSRGGYFSRWPFFLLNWLNRVSAKGFKQILN